MPHFGAHTSVTLEVGRLSRKTRGALKQSHAELGYSGVQGKGKERENALLGPGQTLHQHPGLGLIKSLWRSVRAENTS